MAPLDEDMKRLIEEQRLGYYATVNEDGSPNLFPKGTTFVLDDEQIFFADIRSPQTVANVERGSLVEVNVIDPLSRRGYRFKGPAAVHREASALFEQATGRMAQAGSRLVTRVRAVVVVRVREARPLTSPVYDDGVLSEEEVVRLFRTRLLDGLG